MDNGRFWSGWDFDRMTRWAVAIGQFFKSPSLVGSAFPASRALVNALLAPIDWSSTKLVVEYGPGTGPITRAILRRLASDGRLLAIDVNEGFTRYLRRSIRDHRLITVSASAEEVNSIMRAFDLDRADAIVTGLPFSTLEPGVGARIVDASANALRPDGRLLAYQMRATIAPLLNARFAQVTTSWEWRNIPPCHLYAASHPIATSSDG